MDHPLYVLFDQTAAEDETFGPSILMRGDAFHLCRAIEAPLNARRPAQPAESRVYSLKPRCLPKLRSLGWNEDLNGERRLGLKEADAELLAGNAMQVFVYNGDGDCVRHYLVLPVAEPRISLP